MNMHVACPTEHYQIGWVCPSLDDGEPVYVVEVESFSISLNGSTNLAGFLIANPYTLGTCHPCLGGIKRLPLWRDSAFPSSRPASSRFEPMDAIFHPYLPAFGDPKISNYILSLLRMGVAFKC